MPSSNENVEPGKIRKTEKVFGAVLQDSFDR